MGWQTKARRAAHLGVQRSRRVGKRIINKALNRVTSRQAGPIVPNWYTASDAVHLEGADVVISRPEAVVLTYRPDEKEDTIDIKKVFSKSNRTMHVQFRAKVAGDVTPAIKVSLYQRNKHSRDVFVYNQTPTDIALLANETKVRFTVETEGKGSYSVIELNVNGVSLWDVEGMAYHMQDSDFDYRIDLTPKQLELISAINRVVDFEDDKLLLHGVGGQYVHFGVGESALPHVNTKRAIDFPLGDMDDDVYRFYLKGTVTGTANASLFVVTYTADGQDQMIEVPLGLSGIIRLTPSHTTVRYFVRLSGHGELHGLKLGMVREKSVRREEILSLKPSMWTVPTPDTIKLKHKHDQLVVKLKTGEGNRRYISYAETNNSFKLLPVDFLFDVKSNSRYRVTLDGEMGEGTNVVLYIITYSTEGRLNMQQVQLGSEKIFEFEKEARRLRFALRVDGDGEAVIDRIRVTEEIISDRTRSPEWLDVREARLFRAVPRELHELKVAAIFDEFTTASYRPECDLITFTPDNWPAVLADEQPDFLMVESAWKGNAGAWEKKVVKYGTNTWEELDGLLEWCRHNNIPTVFWNKEDPIHYDRFIETAKRFDYVYTTDENRVEDYIRDCGHDRVGALPFAAQPKEHNPIRLPGTREPYASFAGSYYANRHESRRQDMDRLFAAADRYGLVIYDRNYEMNQRGETDQLQFPEQFRDSIRGSLKYNQIAKAYKGFKVMLNVNSVNDSPTMFSRRVFEGLACATPVVSTRSIGVKQMLGDYVFLDEGDAMLDETFKKLLTDDAFYEDVAMRGMRHVLTYHTYTQRLAQVVGAIGIPYRVDHARVAMVAIVRSKEEMERVVSIYETQDYKHTHLVVFLDKFDGYIDVYNEYNTETISTFMLSYLTQYNALSEILDGFEWMAFVNRDDYYGPSYVSDYILAARYADANILTKGDHYTFDGKLEKQDVDASYRYVFDAVPTRSLVKPAALRFYSIQEALDVLTNDASLQELAQSGERIFSIDPYQYVKGGANLSDEMAQEVTL